MAKSRLRKASRSPGRSPHDSIMNIMIFGGRALAGKASSVS